MKILKIKNKHTIGYCDAAVFHIHAAQTPRSAETSSIFTDALLGAIWFYRVVASSNVFASPAFERVARSEVQEQEQQEKWKFHVLLFLSFIWNLFLVCCFVFSWFCNFKFYLRLKSCQKIKIWKLFWVFL